MQHEYLESLPTVIAKPYAFSKSHPRMTKDYQYFTVEYGLGTLCSIGYALLEQRSITPKKPYGIDYSKMTMGLWVSLLRNICKEIADASPTGALDKAFAAMPSNGLLASIDKFVVKRNRDMHGNPIKQDMLENELAVREALIRPILDFWGQLPDWKFVYFDNIKLDKGETVYVGYELHGEQHRYLELRPNRQANLTADGGWQPKKHRLYFLNLKDSKQQLPISTLLIWASNSTPPRMAVFAKCPSLKKDLIEYNSVEGAVHLRFSALADTPLKTLQSSFRSFLYRFNPSKRSAPQVEAQWNLDRTQCNVGEELTLSLCLKNQSPDYNLRNLRLSQTFGEETIIKPTEDESMMVSCSQQENQSIASLHVEELLAKDGMQQQALTMMYSEQGSYRLQEAELIFEYSDILVDLEEDEEPTYKLGQVAVEGAPFEVIDPNSTTPFRPIINTTLSLGDNPKVEIGDTFALSIEVENIGFATAQDVDIELILPDAFSLVLGKPSLQTSIPARDKRHFTLTFLCWEAGVYQILLRDIFYTDSNQKRFISTTTKGIYVLIQSNKQKSFEYTMIQAYKDLYIEPHEEAALLALKSNTPKLDDAEYERLDRDIRRNRIVEIFEDKLADYPIEPEETFSPGRRDLVYFLDDIPLFGVCLAGDAGQGDTTQCIGLGTSLSKPALQKQRLLPAHPLLKEWLPYQQVRKDPAYRDRFFYQWFGSMKRSLDVILLIRDVARQLQAYLGADEVVFKEHFFRLHFSEENAQKIGCSPRDLLYFKIDEEDYTKCHVIVRLPNTDTILANLASPLALQYYTTSLQPATRRTYSIGFVQRIRNPAGSQAAVHNCRQLWDIAQAIWMRSLCTHERLGATKTYMNQLSAGIVPLLDQGLGMVLDHENKTHVWFYDRSQQASPFVVQGKDIWGYIRTTSSAIHMAFLCREGSTIPEEMHAGIVFKQSDSHLFYEWKVNSYHTRIPDMLELMAYQLERSDGPGVILPAFFGAWMQTITQDLGYIVFELLQVLKKQALPVAQVAKTLNISKYRLRRIMDNIVLNRHQRRIQQVIELVNDSLTLNPFYDDGLEQWLSQQEQVQHHIHTSIDCIISHLHKVFRSEDGWTIRRPASLRVWQTIEVYRDEWRYGIHGGSQLAIAVSADRGYFNRLAHVGIRGRGDAPMRELLFQKISAHMAKQGITMKRSNHWPIYYPSAHIPEQVKQTGGSQWKHTTAQQQEAFAAQIAGYMSPFQEFSELITQTAQDINKQVHAAWHKTHEKLYQQPAYCSLAISEDALQLERYTLAKELPVFTQRLQREDWNFSLAALAWPWDEATARVESKQEVLSKWGRLGVNVGSQSWKPGLFVGCLISGQDHREELIDPQGGADLAIILSVHRKAHEDGISGDEYVETAQWQQLKSRLTSDNQGFTVVDHLQKERPNRWHPLHLRIPLREVWASCTTMEERYEQYHSWLKKGVELVLAGKELQRIRG